MASAYPAKADTARQDWLLANPWSWVLLGLGLCLLAWVMGLVLDDALIGARVLFIFLGLVAAGAGIWIRLGSAAPAYLEQMAPDFRGVVLFALTVLFALLALTTTGLFLLRALGVESIPWKPNSLFILWMVVAPLGVAAAWMCGQRLKPGRPLGAAEESAALLALASLASFIACWALYNPERPEDWDSIRLFLAVLALVPLVAAPLVLVSQALRRVTVSLLIVLHFGGIASAALGPPPSPWIVGQIWLRIYRPYLEFMYLNNAYHFYAPEPGPASYLWFRMFYEAPDGRQFAHWYKVPDVDDRGYHRNAVALEYQRILALTENAVPTDQTPNTSETAAMYARRLEHSANLPAPLLGQDPLPKKDLGVPMHPFIPHMQQYLLPNLNSKVIVASYARHVCRMPHPQHPDWKIKSVKVYRVVHMIAPAAQFTSDVIRMDPRDPELYRPYYMGRFDPNGNLLDAPRYKADGSLEQQGDPFLYWLLPILRDNASDTKSGIKNWAAKHAGDPSWTYAYNELEKKHKVVEERNP